MELKARERIVRLKIVYYGPAVGGKTTNLQKLHLAADLDCRGDMLSVDSAQDRTILFDLLPLKGAGFKGFELHLQMVGVPGQAMYAATRRLVLRGVDGVVFVANSALDRWEENLASFQEMNQYLTRQQIDPAVLPLVLQYNKRDLPKTTSIDELDQGLNARRVPAIPAVATRGEGVLETFSAILSATMLDVSKHSSLLAMERGQNVEEWTRQVVREMYGRPSLAPPPGHEPPPVPVADAKEDFVVFHDSVTPVMDTAPRQRTVKVALPDEAVERASSGPDARANESLVEIYAQASTDLAAQLEELREERDRARLWVDDLRQTMLATEALALGAPPKRAFGAVLGRMLRGTRCRVASAVTAGAGSSAQTLACLGMAKDPILTHPSGVEYVSSRLLGESEPSLRHAADDPALAELLAVCTPPFGAVASLPLKGEKGVQGLCLLYFREGAHVPDDRALDHMADLARRLAIALERERAATSERSSGAVSSAALPGAAALHGLGDIGVALASLWERLEATGLAEGTPPTVGSEIREAAAVLVDVLREARAIVDFSQGVIRREPVDVRELLESARRPGVTITAGHELGVVSGSRSLLRLALDVGLEMTQRSTKTGVASEVTLQASRAGNRIEIAMTVPGTAPGEAEAMIEQGLLKRIAEQHGGAFGLVARDGRVELRITLGEGVPLSS